MPVIKAFDLAYGRLRAPDLDKEEEFLALCKDSNAFVLVNKDDVSFIKEFLTRLGAHRNPANAFAAIIGLWESVIDQFYVQREGRWLNVYHRVAWRNSDMPYQRIRRIPFSKAK